MVLAEGVRDLHPKRAARVVTRAEQLGFHLAPAFEDLSGESVATLTITGELHAVGRAIEQLQAERPLQRLQPATDRGLGGAQLRRRRRETAGIDDSDERA